MTAEVIASGITLPTTSGGVLPNILGDFPANTRWLNVLAHSNNGTKPVFFALISNLTGVQYGPTMRLDPVGTSPSSTGFPYVCEWIPVAAEMESVLQINTSVPTAGAGGILDIIATDVAPQRGTFWQPDIVNVSNASIPITAASALSVTPTADPPGPMQLSSGIGGSYAIGTGLSTNIIPALGSVHYLSRLIITNASTTQYCAGTLSFPAIGYNSLQWQIVPGEMKQLDLGFTIQPSHGACLVTVAGGAAGGGGAYFCPIY